MTTSFDIDALRAAVVGIEQQSFSRAAVELGLSQPAISRQMKKLEQQAGTKLFERQGRGLVPTEAGESLLDYARQIITLNDKAANALGASVAPETVRIGLPQDFYDDVMPEAMEAFSATHPGAHVMVRAGNNHIINDEIEADRLDAAIAFFSRGSTGKGELLCELPLYWLAHESFAEPEAGSIVPLVLFNHPCLFRQDAVMQLDKAGTRWRAALTTPSLHAVWAAIRSGFGIGVRIGHSVPDDILDVGHWSCLPDLPKVELRLLASARLSPAAQDMLDLLKQATLQRLKDRAAFTPRVAG